MPSCSSSSEKTAGCIGWAFLSLATHGVDQLIVYRYLCAKSKRAAAWSLGEADATLDTDGSTAAGVSASSAVVAHPPSATTRTPVKT